MENITKKDPAKKSHKERYKYNVNTNNADEEVIDFVPLDSFLIDKEKHNRSETQKPRKTNIELISRYLTLNPIEHKGANATIEQTKLSEDLELVTLVDNDGKRGSMQKYYQMKFLS